MIYQRIFPRRLCDGATSLTNSTNLTQFPLTPALSPSAGEREKLRDTRLRRGGLPLSPAEGERGRGKLLAVSSNLCVQAAASLAAMWLACSPFSAAAGKIPIGFSEHFADVNGVRLHYFIGGKGSPVVLLHGYAETSRMWLPIMPLLAQRHTVIIPDLRGAGGSAKPESGYDKKTMAVDIHELTSSLGFDRVSIVGHDIGLMVAYAYAAQFPQTAERVILMDAFLPGIGDWTHVWLLRDLWHFHFHGEVPL